METHDLETMEAALREAMLEILQEHDLEAIKDIIACLEIVYQEMLL